jgi:Family of unknown function (DUF5677)
MKNSKVLEIYSQLLPLTDKVSVGDPNKDPLLNLYVGASFAKCIEYNLAIFNESNDEISFFTSSGLRGICEDFITLKYLHEKVDSSDLNVLLKAWAMKQLSEGINEQEVFFQTNKSDQPVIKYSKKYKDIAIASESALKFYAVKYRWKKNDFSPSISQMASACSLRPLYKYLYAATSKSVHFSPHFFMRMGWGDIEKHNTVFKFSTRNFSRYYADFGRFYGTFLFVKFCDTFGDLMAITTEIKKSIDELRNYLEESPRWPELVTFEEMNLEPPNFSLIQTHMSYLKDLSTIELHETLKEVLLERKREQISGMDTTEKREEIRGLIGNKNKSILDSIPDNRLDAALISVGELMLEKLKPNLKASDVAQFFAAIPPEDVIRYLESASQNTN